MIKFKVGDNVILTGRAYRVCSLTIHDDVYCLETSSGSWFHAHAANMKHAYPVATHKRRNPLDVGE
jgi:hypothetical protein